MAPSTTYDDVNDHYSRISRERAEGNERNSEKVALSFGYSLEELSAIPEGANLGVSCGNPIALAGLKEGETVVDLGSGGGFDVFMAARKVGDAGIAIGIDMSKDMLARARLNASKSNITNVKFVESKITQIDLPPDTSNCVISNCVINLVPEQDKHLVFKEIYRVLKPGGRLAVSDILAKKPFPGDMRKSIALYVGCISGASMVEEYEKYLKDAGFEDVLIVDKNVDLNVYEESDLFETDEKIPGQDDVNEMHPSCCGTGGREVEIEKKATSCCGTSSGAGQEQSSVVSKTDFNEWVGSYNIYAVKPL